MLATMASVTSATRIKRYILELGVSSAVIQTPHTIAKEGCGYSLRFDDCAKNIVLGAAEHLGIRVRALYSESDSDGKKVYSKIIP